MFQKNDNPEDPRGQEQETGDIDKSICAEQSKRKTANSQSKHESKTDSRHN